MFFALFIFTTYHNTMIIVASLFGLPAVIGILLEIYRSELYWYKLFGVVSLLALAICNILYYGDIGIAYLPLIQKMAFVVVLGWVAGLSVKMLKMK